ncbi:exosortase A [Luteitalea pratensis]|uniref:Exosortase A n=1 Tax=Luteitalea pratensis TaxID=1855912 RepID=A0A143PNS9_LUTPR|nr:exosortase/archaeosortase family protein [Luteitalea pratensis]AMY10066.1 exosortase A [Luteitalea pratensis]
MAQEPLPQIAVSAPVPTTSGVPAHRHPGDAAASPVWVGVLAVLVSLVYGPTAVWLFGRWTMSVWHNAHGALVLPVAGWLMWQELRSTWKTGPASSAWGWAFVVPALLLHVLDQGMQTQLLSAISFVVLLPGLSLLLLGTDRTRRIAFPLAFVALMLPIPLAVTERLHLVLRNVVASACAVVVPWLGIPILKVGTTLHMPNASLLVADACSGFSTLYAAGAVALLTMFLSASPRRRVLVGLLFAPIALAINIVRVALLCVLVYFQGTDVLATSLHELSGIVTFVVALPLIFWLGGPARPIEEVPA